MGGATEALLVSDLFWLAQAQMRRIEPTFQDRTGCGGSTTGAS
jgi:hypothetical protein